MAKACRRFCHRIEAVVEAGGDFFNNPIKYIPMNITCKFEQNILKINLLIAFLMKKFKTVGYSLRTLYIQYITQHTKINLQVSREATSVLIILHTVSCHIFFCL